MVQNVLKSFPYASFNSSPGDCSTPLESLRECRGLSMETSVGVRMEPSLLVPTELKMKLHDH